MFVSDEARVACGPCNTRAPSENKKVQRGSACSLSTQVRDSARPDIRQSKESMKRNPPQCYYCKGNHIIQKCNAFLGKDSNT